MTILTVVKRQTLKEAINEVIVNVINQGIINFVSRIYKPPLPVGKQIPFKDIPSKTGGPLYITE